MKDKRKTAWKELQNFVLLRRKTEKRTTREAEAILDILGIKVGQIFTEAELIDKVCNLFKLSKYKAKTLQELVLGLDGYPPSEAIDFLNIILNSQCVETVFKRRSVKK